MGRKKFTQDQIDDIINLYTEDKLGTPSIGEKYGVHKKTVQRVLKKNGIKIDTPGRRYKGGKSESAKRYYERNKNYILNRYKNWAKNNRESLREYHKKWRDENRNELREKQRNKERERRRDDNKYRLNVRFRTALYNSLKKNSSKKYNSTFEILDYSFEDLVSHLEKQFTEGMNWDNYGEWHIDHIIPASKFDFKDENDFEFKQCWRLDNLRPMWATTKEINNEIYEGNLNKSNKTPNTCYQFRIKKLKEIKENKKFSDDFLKKVDLSESKVRPIDRKKAKDVIKEYEWLQFMPSFTKYHFGIFFNIDGKEYLGGVVCYQTEYGENNGTWDKYDYTNKILLLSRGASVWWTPKNTSSKLVGGSLNWLKHNTNYKIITATVDRLAGEFGTVYQATNWYYIGVMPGNILKNGKERKRLGVIVGDKMYSSRQIRNKLGTMKKDVILKTYPNAKFVDQKPKDRYFYFIGNKTENKYHSSKIKDLLKPYPKRGSEY